MDNKFLLRQAKELYLNLFTSSNSSQNEVIEKIISNPVYTEISKDELLFEINKKEKPFKPKANILVLLGEELIKNPVMAIYELVKNSYDADSTYVNLDFLNVNDSTNKTTIIIEDDGVGMTEDIIKNVWLEPGTDFRKPYDSEGLERTIKRSNLYNRVPMGEKGIGRFAVHKLSHKIKVITRPTLIDYDYENQKVLRKTLQNYEIELFIDWDLFLQKSYLSDIYIEWNIKEDIQNFHFKEDSGTRIELSEIKTPWNRGMARDLKRQIESMVSPKMISDRFLIDLDFHNNWLDGLQSIDDAIQSAPYQYTALITSDFDFTFEYKFSPQNQHKLRSRIIAEKSVNVKNSIGNQLRTKLKEEGLTSSELDNYISKFNNNDNDFNIGDIMFEIYSYDLDSKSLRDTISNPKLIKSILKNNAGIKVYKDDLRVYNYGDPKNDWLGLDLNRINNSDKVSNNQNIGYIILDAEKANNLIEKTNREGFIEDEYFKLFLVLVDFFIIQFSAERQKDKKYWQQFNKESQIDSFKGSIGELNTLIETAQFRNSTEKNKVIKVIQNIEEKYDEQRQTLLIPAGMGITTSIAIHEIEKIVPRFKRITSKKIINIEELDNCINDLEAYVSSISSILRRSKSPEINVKDAANKAVRNYKYKLLDRKINSIVDISNNFTIFCDLRLFISMIMNLVDNSMYWLDDLGQSEKNILIKSVEIDNEHKSIIIADNGNGFKDEIIDLVRPYFTRKPRGMGIGLYLIDTIMMNYGKLNILTQEEAINYDIPPMYKGAIVELSFHKKQK
jgi:signal transduction histidine kinase